MYLFSTQLLRFPMKKKELWRKGKYPWITTTAPFFLNFFRKRGNPIIFPTNFAKKSHNHENHCIYKIYCIHKKP